MIPKTITRKHIIAAARFIDSNGVPKHREATKFEVTIAGRKYPPKYLTSIASQIAIGRSLKPDEFGGGDETNGFLKRLGFAVHEIGRSEARTGSAKRAVKIARAWLTMGMTMTEFKKEPEDRSGGTRFKRMVEQKHFSKKDYYQRLRRLAHDAKNAGADILVLPACAMMYKGAKFKPREVLGSSVPGIVASGRFRVGQRSRADTAVILQGGQSLDTDAGVRWIHLKGKPYSIMAAVSSTINAVRTQPWMDCPSRPGRWAFPRKVKYNPQCVKWREVPPPPNLQNNAPVLVLDMGHQRYSSHYLLHPSQGLGVSKQVTTSCCDLILVALPRCTLRNFLDMAFRVEHQLEGIQACKESEVCKMEKGQHELLRRCA